MLSWRNEIERAGAEISADSEVMGLGVRSLLTPQVADVWRSGAWGASTVTLRADLGAVREGLRLVLLAAPRDGLLPGPGALVRVAASAIEAPSGSGLQNSPTVVTTAIPYGIGANTTDLGTAPAPNGGTGARRLGSISATGGGVFLCRSSRAPASPNTAYRLVVWLRSAAAPPSIGRALTVDEFTQHPTGGTMTRSHGEPIAGSVSGEWQRFERTIVTRPDTQSLQCYYAEGWQQGAEIEAWGCHILPLGEAMDVGPELLDMSPWGLWCHVAPVDFAARHVMVQLTGATTDLYAQLGRLWVGPAVVTAHGPAYGWRRSAMDTGLATRAALSGVRHARRGVVARRLAFQMPALSRAEAEAVARAAIEAGETGQVFAAPSAADAARLGVLGRLVQPPEVAQISHTRFSAAISIEEDF